MDIYTALRLTLIDKVLLLVYMLYVLFQLKSHAYLYASIPQRIIDEESHPGVLADLMNSSSDSSGNSSDETADSAASKSTAKRIKRAVRHRIRKKASFSSSRETHHHKKNTAAVDDVDADSNSNAGSRPDFSVIDFCDNETAYHADDDDDMASLNNKNNNNNNNNNNNDNKRVKSIRMRTMTSSNIAAVGGGGDRRIIIKEESKEDARRKSPLRPAFPLLSNTVFSNPENSAYGLRRASSLPAHMNHSPMPMPPVGNAVQFARGAARMPSSTAVPKGATVDPPPLHQPADMSRTAAVVMLMVSTALVAVCAEFLVDAIPEMIQNSSVSQAFIGLIILPIVSNAAEHVTAVSVAAKNKMDLAIGVSVGSSIQIAIFITPLVVILGWCMNKDMSLYFTLFETISLFATAFVVNFLVLDGRSNYLEGSLLIAAYVIIA